MKSIILTAVITLLQILSQVSFSQSTSSIIYDSGTTIDVGTGADICADNITINGTYSGEGTKCDGPLPVTISSFTYAAFDNRVKLLWVVETELNNSGFDVERKESKVNAQWQQIAFIQGRGTVNTQKFYYYEDKKLEAGKYNYRLKQIDYNGNFEYYQLASEVNISAPHNFLVSQNYPNPSNPKSRIDFQIPSDGLVTIKIYDITGKEVASLMDEFKRAGYYSVEFDGTNLASGVYFYRISSGTNMQTKKMLLVK